MCDFEITGHFIRQSSHAKSHIKLVLSYIIGFCPLFLICPGLGLSKYPESSHGVP